MVSRQRDCDCSFGLGGGECLRVCPVSRCLGAGSGLLSECLPLPATAQVATRIGVVGCAQVSAGCRCPTGNGADEVVRCRPLQLAPVPTPRCTLLHSHPCQDSYRP